MDSVGHSFGCRSDEYWLKQSKNTMKKFFIMLRRFAALEPKFMDMTEDQVPESDGEDLLNTTIFYLDSNLLSRVK